MANSNINISINLVWWFYGSTFGYFTVDEIVLDELEGIIHQLYAEENNLI